MGFATKPLALDETLQRIAVALEGGGSVVEERIDHLGVSLATKFSEETAYTVGAYVIHDDTLYKCSTAHTGEWDETHFTAVMATSEILTIASSLKSHETLSIYSENGAHGIRYWEETLAVKIGGEWVEIKTGGGDGGGSTITVTTDADEFYGLEVKLSNGSQFVTGTFSDSGVCVFNGVTFGGTLTASVTYDGDTYSDSVEVSYYGAYTIELSLGETFTLNITTKETSLYGKDITISSGTKTKTTSFNIAGQATAKVHFTGEVTLTSTDGTETATKKVTIVSDTPSYDIKMSFIQIWGVEWDGSSTQVWSRTDDAEDYVDPSPAINNGTGSSPFDDVDGPWKEMVRVTDSEAGECVKLPRFWYKWTFQGTTMKLQIADGEEDGFSVCPACRDIDGTGERPYILYGRYHCANGTYKSTTGVVPQASKTRADFRTAIHALGSTVWQADYAARVTIYMLYLVEFANWDTQKTIGYGCGNNSGVQAMGYTDSMQYHTGTSAANRTTYGLGTQYRYIEGLWDNVYDWCDGIYFSTANIYVINNPANFSDTSGGTLVGTRPTSGGYISAWSKSTASGFDWFIYPSAVAGSEDTFVGDYCDYLASGVVLRVGGNYGQSRNRGLFFLLGDSAASYQYADIGSRLMKIPAAA